MFPLAARIIIPYTNWPDAATGGDYYLKRGSPYIDTGIYRDWMANSVDLDGRPRVRYGLVDMGCYEYKYIPGGTVFMVR